MRDSAYPDFWRIGPAIETILLQPVENANLAPLEIANRRAVQLQQHASSCRCRDRNRTAPLAGTLAEHPRILIIYKGPAWPGPMDRPKRNRNAIA